MPPRRPFAVVLLATLVTLAVGFWPTPFWDEDEPRFAAIARTMLETGDWVVPIYNGTLAVDKPVLMHWCMAACFWLFGTSETAARLPAALATVLTALALLRAGTRWFSPLAGVLAALAYVGCLLVAVESHAATPDAILTALTTWATVLIAGAFLPGDGTCDGRTACRPVRLSFPTAMLAGGLMGLAVLCKGPIGFVGPLAVVLPWAWSIDFRRRLAGGPTEPRAIGARAHAACAAVLDAVRATRLLTVSLAMVAVAGPWYLAVGLRTAGAWPAAFFFVHNVGRFAAPMEKHGGGAVYHPLGLLVGFYPWSCFLPLAIAVAGWRIWKRAVPHATALALGLAIVWLTVWVGAFSAAATKLPNYIMPAYPAAALLVAAFAADAAGRGRWPHPAWLASGVGWLAFGGIATSAVVITATWYGLEGGTPVAIIGLVPIIGAIACVVAARRDRLAPLAVFTVTALVYTSLAVGPAAGWLARANALPALVGAAHEHAGGRARLGTLGRNSPNIIYYADGPVHEWEAGRAADAAAFLATGPDAVVIVSEPAYAELAASLPPGCGIVARARPLFQKHDSLLVGTKPAEDNRTATTGNLTR